MGITVRREPIVSDIPKAPKYKYLNITDFKGINKTDNPFTAKVNTASEMLNLYVDESNALTTRPRLEWFMKLNLSITTGKIISVNRVDDKYLVQYTQTSLDTTAKLAWITDAGVKTDITVVSGCTISPTNKIQVFKGPTYYVLVDGVSYKIISGNSVNNASASGSVYKPITKTGKIIGDGSSGVDFESPNILTDKYREEYIVGPLQDPMNLVFGEFKDKRVEMIGRMGDSRVFFGDDSEEGDQDIRMKYQVFRNNDFGRRPTGLASSKNLKVIVACFDDNTIEISKDYGKSFNYKVLPYSVKGVAVGGVDANNEPDGSIIFALYNCDDNGIKYSISIDGGETFTEESYGSYSSGGTQPVVIMSDTGEKIIVSINKNGTYTIYSCKTTNNTRAWVKHTMYDTTGTTTGVQGLSECHIIFADDAQTKFYCLLVDTNHIKASLLNLRLIGETTYDNSAGQYYLSSYPDWGSDIRNFVRVSNNRLVLLYRNPNGCIQGIPASADSPLTFTWNPQPITDILPEYYDDAAVTYANHKIAVISSWLNVSTISFYKDSIYNDDFEFVASSTVTTDTQNNNVDIIFSADAINAIGYSGTVLFSNYAYSNGTFLIVDESSETNPNQSLLDKLNKSLFIQSFHNYLWLGGSGNLVVRTGVAADTGQNHLLYLPKAGYKLLGDDTNVVTGFNISNDITMIAYLKDNLWTISYGELSEGVYDFIYTEVRSNQGHIAVGETITTPLQEIPLQLNTTGVFGYQQITNVITSDKTSVLLTEPINELLLKESELTKAFFINHLYWTLMFVPNEENTHVYVYDDRYNTWYYWEIYTRLVSVVTIDDSVVIIDSAGLFYKLTSEDALDEFVPDKTVYYDWYGNDANQNKIKKIIPWLWKSQIMPLGTINYAKRLVTTTFIMTDTDAVDEYSLNYKFNVYRKLVSQSNLTTISNRLNYIQSMTKKTMIPRFNYLQLELSNVDDETDMDNNKLRLVGLAFKYVLLEVLI